MPQGRAVCARETRSRRDILREKVYGLFTDHLMTVLALLLVPATLLPLVFKFSKFMLIVFDTVNYFVIVVFALEYVLKLLAAESRRSFVLDPWHLLDLAIILLAGVDLIPGIPLPGGRASPLLRLIRLVRVFAVAGRAASRAGVGYEEAEAAPAVSRLRATAVEDGRLLENVPREAMARLVDSPAETWLDLQDFGEPDLDFVSGLIHLPRAVLASKTVQKSFPHIDVSPAYTTIFLWDSRIADDGAASVDVSRQSLLIVLVGTNIVTVSTGSSGLVPCVAAEGGSGQGSSLRARVLHAIMRKKVADCTEIVRALERETAAMEEAPVGKATTAFLEETFRVKKVIQQMRYGLSHLRQVLATLKAGKATQFELDEDSLGLISLLHEEVEYLYGTLETVRDNLISLIELHINAVSFDMNRVMRILAVITCLALVPAVIGGLLGENLADSPYPVSIFEISFLVASLMLLGLYAFWRQGWLR